MLNAMINSLSKTKDMKLPELPFEHFFRFAEMEAFAKDLAEAAPDLVHLSEIGQSREGRPLYMLTITDFSTGSAEDKPAYLIHGNIHSVELAGTHASLFTARQLVLDHKPGGLLEQVAFYIIPRINPDGAEFCVTTNGTSRSRLDTSEKCANTLYQSDVNGDGMILKMRIENPNGAWAKNPNDPRLMVLRTAETPGPYYDLLPEGLIYDWDGTRNLNYYGRSFDWNRNWSYNWIPEPGQAGAGDFPFSETEMHAMGQFIHSHHNLFAILGYHTGTNAILRPPSSGTDDDIDKWDLKTMHRIAEIASECTGFPIIPVYNYRFRRIGERAKDIMYHGHFHDFGYRNLGLYVYEFELGTVLNSAGITSDQVFGTPTQTDLDELLRQALNWIDQQGLFSKFYRDWQEFQHPQFGKVEIGGWLSQMYSNPTMPDLRRIVQNTYQFTLKHAEFRPQLTVEEVSKEAVGDQIYRVRARLVNHGRLPTNISNRGSQLSYHRPMRVEIKLAPGVKLLSSEGHRVIRQLEALNGNQLLEWFVSAPASDPTLISLNVKGWTGGSFTVDI